MSDEPPRAFVDRRAAATPEHTGLLAQVSANAGKMVAIGGAIAIVFTGLGWLTGPLRPQSQIDLANLQKTNVEIVARIDAMAATQASDKALLIAQIELLKQLFATRLDAMWRPSDFADRDSHLSRLDSVFEALRDKTTDNTYAIKDLQEKYRGLTTVPTPGPRR